LKCGSINRDFTEYKQPENMSKLMGQSTRCWCRLFAKFDPKDVVSWHKVTHECRKAFYLQYGFLYSAIFLTFTLIISYLIAQFLSYNISHLLLIAYIIIILFLYVIISYIHGIKNNQNGAWRNFKEHSRNFFNSDEFDYFIKNNLCFQITSKKEIESIMTMNNYLSYLVENKLLVHLCKNKDSLKYNKANLRRIMQHITALYHVLYEKQYHFRSALFLLSEDQKYLFPFVRDDTNYSRYYCLNDKSTLHTISSNFFSIDGESIAAETWRTQNSISRDSNLKTVCPASNDHLKSIYCYPLNFNNDIYEILQSIGAEQKINFGILCIDCNAIETFSRKNHKLNSILLKPFVERIIYEITLGIYYYIKEKS